MSRYAWPVVSLLSFAHRAVLLVLLLIFCSILPATAGVFSSDFNTKEVRGTHLYGDAWLDSTGGVQNSGFLRLTEAQAKSHGTLILDDFDQGRPVYAFNVRFKISLGTSEGAVVDEGFSVNFGQRPPTDIGANGTTNGLSLCFTPYRGNKGNTIPSIRVRYNGTYVAAPYFSLRTEGNFADVQIELDRDGSLTVVCNGAVAFDHTKAFDYQPRPGQFAIGAQNGDHAGVHLLDDLWITTETQHHAEKRKSRIQNQPVKAKATSQFNVRGWHLEDGLPQNMVQALVQTRDGYIWAGTRKGLARFDGVRFTVFNTENTPILTNCSITSLAASRDGSLWVGTDQGALNYRDGVFTRLPGGLPSERVKVLTETHDGILIIGTLKGAVRFEKGQYKSLLPDGTNESEAVRSITEDHNGGIWIALGYDIYHIDRNGTVDTYSTTAGFNINMIRTLVEDTEGVMWAGSNGGLFALKDGKWTRYSQRNIAHSVVGALCNDRAGDMWVGNFGGLSRLTNGKMRIELNNSGEPFDVVNAICEDAEGNIWLGAKDGLFQLRPRRVTVYGTQQGLSYNNVMSVLEDRNGAIWISTWGGGLNRFADGVFTAFGPKNSLATDLILSLCEDRDGSLWLGTDYGSGVYHYANGYFKYNGSEKGISTSAIRVVFQDSKTNLWLGTSSCTQRINPSNEVAVYAATNGLAGNDVREILEDHKSNIWVATTDGLSCFTTNGITNVTKATGLSDNHVLALYEDAAHDLWIGTESGTLDRWRDGHVRHYTRQDGMQNEEIFGILDDDLGNIWLASLNGIWRVSRKELDDLDRGLTTKLDPRHYSKEQGTVSIQCNGISKPVAWKAKDGRLWFATSKGAAVIDPRASATKNMRPPPVSIEEVLADKKIVARHGANDIIHLSPGHGEFEVHYTALSLQVPEKNRFKYRLEGFDSDWIDVGTRRVAYYNNLDPGEYTFHVIACNNDGVWNNAGDSFSFYLEPHFYQTKWFAAACVVSLVAVVAGVYLLNVNRLRRRQRILEAEVEERTKHLKDEITERQKIQTQLIDVSRQAGMAEVASGVLHNVGNVLNSVNVSATLAAERLRSSKQASLEKAFALIQQNAHNLPAFFTEDPKGKQLPDYLRKLSVHLAEEQTLTLQELTSLRKNVDHIKDIIAMQQQYAKISGVTESVHVSELVEDALRMNISAGSSRPVKVRSEFRDDPVLSLDKNKALQIIINLIQNAKDACTTNGKTDGMLAITTSRADEHVLIAVTDNGVGIPAENLTKIFSLGFTTRPNGHGFGLHNSALAAKEIGGKLTAQSEGAGCGATFILELPLNPRSPLAPT